MNPWNKTFKRTVSFLLLWFGLLIVAFGYVLSVNEYTDMYGEPGWDDCDGPLGVMIFLAAGLICSFIGIVLTGKVSGFTFIKQEKLMSILLGLTILISILKFPEIKKEMDKHKNLESRCYR